MTVGAVDSPASKMNWKISVPAASVAACAGGHQAARHRPAADRVGIKAAPVIGDLDMDFGAALRRPQGQAGAFRLAGGAAFLGRLDAVIDGVAHHMDQRIGQRLDHALVDAHVAAFERQLDRLALLLRQVAHQPRQPVEHNIDRHHTQFQRL